MNNSKIAIDNVFLSKEQKSDKTEWFRKRESELVRIVESINKIASSKEWSTLKTELFDGLVETLEKKISTEAKKEEVNVRELYRLQGQHVWARKYADFKSLSDFFRLELQGIKQQLYGTTEKIGS